MADLLDDDQIRKIPNTDPVSKLPGDVGVLITGIASILFSLGLYGPIVGIIGLIIGIQGIVNYRKRPETYKTSSLRLMMLGTALCIIGIVIFIPMLVIFKGSVF